VFMRSCAPETGPSAPASGPGSSRASCGSWRPFSSPSPSSSGGRNGPRTVLDAGLLPVCPQAHALPDAHLGALAVRVLQHLWALSLGRRGSCSQRPSWSEYPLTDGYLCSIAALASKKTGPAGNAGSARRRFPMPCLALPCLAQPDRTQPHRAKPRPAKPMTHYITNDLAWQGMARFGEAWPGAARKGLVWPGWVWSGWVWRGRARHGWAW